MAVPTIRPSGGTGKSILLGDGDRQPERGGVMEHRAVPIETLREFARDRAELTSVRQVAAEAGLGRTTLRNFLTRETTPHPRVRRLLALWYLSEKAKEPKPFPQEDYVSAFAILLESLPDEHRTQATAALIERLAAMHASAGVEIPPGLAALREQGVAPQPEHPDR